jgi:hypothetical protein
LELFVSMRPTALSAESRRGSPAGASSRQIVEAAGTRRPTASTTRPEIRPDYGARFLNPKQNPASS